ncbi:unnamed protein product [Schistosoma margrebowiei]|uniref:Uncharacterized protein n=1 Tax=Schistosoma margrebowiei TaxID=48269 RepID=A0A183N5F3_9TREM|nr:unnamed protein product [Schistosoma margrebowiei]
MNKDQMQMKGEDWQGKGHIPTIKKHMELNFQPISKSQSSIRTSRRFYCTELKLGELQQLSSRRYKYLYLVVYARYSTSVGRIPSATAFSEREQTSSQLKRKLGKDTYYANHQTAS